MSNRIFKEQQNFRAVTLGPIDGSSAEKVQNGDFQLLTFSRGSDEEQPEQANSAEADELLGKAKKQAEQILADARKEAEEIRRESAEDGFRQGIEKARKEAEEEAAAAWQEKIRHFETEAETALSGIQEAKQRVLSRYLRELMNVSVAVAEKVIHVSLSTSGEVIARMIGAEVEKRQKTAWMKIYIDKQDYDMMVKADADIAQELGHVSDNIKFVVMDSEQQGYCIIETPEEITDISVDSQMDNLRNSLDTVTFEDTNV